MNILNNNNNISGIKQIKQNHFLKYKNKTNNRAFFLKKIFKTNKISKNKFNINSTLDNKENQNSFIYKRNHAFGNELLVELMEKNLNKNNLNILLSDKKNIEEKKEINIDDKYDISDNINYKKNNSRKNRIKSARHLVLDFNKEIEKRFNNDDNERNNFNDNMKKVLAFKENIFVHEKTMSLLDNNYDINNLINSKKNITYNNNDLLNTYSKKKFNNKNNRPKSATYIQIKNNNIKIYNLKMKNSKNKSKIICDNYSDLSYAINNINNKDITKNIKNKITKYNRNNKEKVIKNSRLEYSSDSISINKNLTFDNQNLKDNSNNGFISLSNKKTRGYLFRRRPISIFNEKYLVCLPQNLKKDIKNKYNFFSYLMTDNIFYNTADRKLFKNIKKKKKQNNNNKINHDITEYQNINKEYKLDCRKEEEFMTYLKNLDYTNKHPKKDINRNNNYKILFVNGKTKFHHKNSIYKTIKIKFENSLLNEKIKLNDNEFEFGEKIESHPFGHHHK